MNPIRTVLCPVDFTTVTERTLGIAVQVCRRTGARLVLHHNLGPAPPDFLGVHWMWDEEHGDQVERSEDAVRDQLGKLFSDLPEELEYEAKITRGPLDQGLLHLAETLPADLLVLGSHGSSDAEHHSLTDQVVVRAPCSVMAVAEQLQSGALELEASGDGKLPVVVATNLSDDDRGAVQLACELAGSLPYELHFLHVLKPSHKMTEGQAEALEAEARRGLARLVPEALAERSHLHLKWGSPAPRILETAAELGAVFLVLGARKHGLLYRAFKGLTSLEVLHGSRWPVWFVPAGRPAPSWSATAGSETPETRNAPPETAPPARQGENMDWIEARDKTIHQWEEIRDGLGRGFPVDLVTEVNAVSELCHKSQEVAGSPATRCDYCIAYGDVGGCSRVRLQITEALLAEDWERARCYIDEVLQLLRDSQPPAGSRLQAN